MASGRRPGSALQPAPNGAASCARRACGASDLEGLGLAALDNWARAQAKVVPLGAYFDRAGFLDDETGEPVPATRVDFTALNTARLALVRLGERPGMSLEDAA